MADLMNGVFQIASLSGRENTLLPSNHAQVRCTVVNAGREKNPILLGGSFDEPDGRVLFPMLDGGKDVRILLIGVDLVGNHSARPECFGVLKRQHFTVTAGLRDFHRSLGKQFMLGSDDDVAVPDGQSVDDLIGDQLASIEAGANVRGGVGDLLSECRFRNQETNKYDDLQHETFSFGGGLARAGERPSALRRLRVYHFCERLCAEEERKQLVSVLRFPSRQNGRWIALNQDILAPIC